MHYRYAVLVVSLSVWTGVGQTLIDLRTQTKSVDFTSANATKPFKSGTVLPATCSVGEAFFKTDAAAGANLFGCTALNSWTVEAGDATLPNGSANQVYGMDSAGGAQVWKTLAGDANLDVLTAGASLVFSPNTANLLTRADDVAGADHWLASSGGSGTAYTACQSTLAVASYSAGTWFLFRPDVNSGAGPVTLNVCGLGPQILQKLSSGALANITTNDLVAGNPYLLINTGSTFVVVHADFASAAGAAPAGSGSELQLRLNATTFQALANSSTPNAGELLRSTVPNASTTRAVDWLGSAPAALNANGTYRGINAANNYAGDYDAAEEGGVRWFRIFKDNSDGTKMVDSVLGLGSGFFRMRGNESQVFLQDAGQGATIDFGLGSGGAPSVHWKASTGKQDIYGGLSTAGMGLPPVYASVSSTGNTASIGSTNLQCGGAICPAGLYRANIYQVCSSTGTGNMTSSIGWNDGTAARAKASASLSCTATNFDQFQYVLRADGVNNITYSTNYTSTGTYSLYITLERLQ